MKSFTHSASILEQFWSVNPWA